MVDLLVVVVVDVVPIGNRNERRKRTSMLFEYLLVLVVDVVEVDVVLVLVVDVVEAEISIQD